MHTESDVDLLREFNQTDWPFPDTQTLHELFEQQVRKDPSRIAVVSDHDKVWNTTTLTYGQLNARANQLARVLAENGVRPGQIVGLLLERSLAMMVAVFGTLKAGAAYLPLSTSDPESRLRYVTSDAGAQVLLVHGATLSKAPSGMKVINVDLSDLYAGSDENVALAAGPRDLAYVIYTSGSTGRPKGVMIEHRSAVNRLDWMQRAYPIGPGDMLLQKTPYCFDVSVWELFWWSLTGASLCMMPPNGEKFPQVLIETVRKNKVTVMHFVPSMLNVFLEYLEDKPDRVAAGLSSLRRVFASGEALNPSHVRKFYRIIGQPTGARLTNLYGPTETTVDVTYYDCPADGEPDTVPIGKPIQNIRMYIVQDGAVASIGETGELCVAGIGLARGYLNNPALTAERFVSHPAIPEERVYRTGDLARWLPDGNIEYLGREDHQVKIRGLRIELGEIEKTIQTRDDIADCVVITKKYSESIILLIAYVVCKGDIDVQELKSYLRKHLPEYMIPDHFEKIDRIPLTDHGKVARHALPEPVLRVKTT